MKLPNKRWEDLDFMTEENRKFFVKVIFLKIHKSDSRWHICLPEMTEINGFKLFCGVVSWSEIDTQDRQRLERMMRANKENFCERCAEEFTIAFDVLKAQGYFEWK